MTKTLFRALRALLAVATLFGATLPAHAATLTYNDPNCAGFVITGSGGSYTLTCAKLQCSISGNTTPTTAQNTSLTATCTPTAAGYLWALVTGPFSDPTCLAPSTPTLATTAIVRPTGIVAGQTRSCVYSVTANSASLSGQSMVTVTWSDAPPAPPVCTPTAVTLPSPMTSAGGSVNLNAGCVPSSGVTYTWTRTAPTAGAPTNPTSATPSDALPANPGVSGISYTYQVVACTSPTTCDTKSISVIVPGTAIGVDCTSAGFTKTILVDVPWGAPGSIITYRTQDAPFNGFTGTTALVIRFTAPAGAPATSSYGHITSAEYVDPPTARTAVLSTNACDFTNTIGSPYYAQYGSTIDLSLRVGGVPVYAYHDLRMVPGTTYYLNVKNYNAVGSPTCSAGTCNMIINWQQPY
jgi:hypothetical protein